MAGKFRPWTPLIVPPALNGRVLDHLLPMLVAIDRDYLEEHPHVPSIYESGVRYQAEAPGEEKWLTVPWNLAAMAGDCLPITTPVQRENGSIALLGTLVEGDRIVGDGNITTVTKAGITGLKAIAHVLLDNGSFFLATAEHRFFLSDDREVRVGALERGMALKGSSAPVRVTEIIPQLRGARVLCSDITTDTGRFYLPESDTIVHNCEDLACWRVAELQLRGDVRGGQQHSGPEDARAMWIQQQTPAGLLYHIQVRRADGRVEDPCVALGMGWEKEFTAKYGPIHGITQMDEPWTLVSRGVDTPEVMRQLEAARKAGLR